MAKKKTTKKVAKATSPKKQPVYLLLNCAFSRFTEFEDLNVEEAVIYTKKEDAVRDFERDNDSYIVEVEVKKILTDKILTTENLVEVKLK